jgi:hypothetical protein
MRLENLLIFSSIDCRNLEAPLTPSPDPPSWQDEVLPHGHISFWISVSCYGIPGQGPMTA